MPAATDITRLVAETVATARDIAAELPGARTPGEAADILLRGDRKLHVGVLLVVVTVVALLLGSD